MASMPSINRNIRSMPETKTAQAWVALCTAAGVAIDVARRTLVADPIARLMDAHLASSPKATFAAVAHGMRFVADGQSGAGAPCFVEAKGAGVGEVYIFGGLAKRDGLLAAIGASNIASTRDESKGGLYITLTPDADCNHVYKVLAMHASVRGPVGYRSDMGNPSDLEAVAFVPPAKDETPKAEAKEGTAPKGKRGRPAKGSKAKDEKVTEDKPVDGEAITEAVAS